ncbi:MAG TPA: FkbM family methyltransferase [Candidatus Angelobacter sp.]|jgi:FkbM family methyltransferase|nr:FkbM family methyltransferase [Candidatus Angelobacter sp.]
MTVALGGDLTIFASSALEARYQHREIFGELCYGQIGLPPRALVIDAGANIGLFVLFVKRQQPDATVLAFEPVPESAQVLRKNIELHHLSEVSVHQVALGNSRETEAPLTHYPALPGNSTQHPEQKQLQQTVLARTHPARWVERLHRAQTISVAVERLSTYLDDHRAVDLLKVDVEGAELDVLHGIDARHWPLIRQVVMEVQDLDDRLAQVCDLLERHGLQPAARPAPLLDPDVRTHVVRATARCSG